MSNSYDTYQYIVKSAAPEDAPGWTPPPRTWGGFARDNLSAAVNYPAIRGGVVGVWNTGTRGLGGIRDSAYGVVGTAADTFNVFETPAQRERSVAHTIGKEIGNFFLPKVYDPDDLGPYEEYSDYLKDTEQGEMYLSQAAVLRRAARKVLRERKQKEMEKEHASSSRYF